MAEGLIIQPMQPSDLAFAARCTAAEGWESETPDHFESLYAHDPLGCFVARLDGQAAGICFATPYSHSGFIGELVVRAEFRQRGIGGALLNRAATYLRERGLNTIYLDGVVAAVPLYERNGFRKICRSLRFVGRVPQRIHPQVRSMQSSDLPEIYRLDRQAFGDDRSFFLERRWRLFPELFKVLVVDGNPCGYITARRVKDFIFAGPWVVAPGVTDALPLLEGLACEERDAFIALGILESNSQAVKLARLLGMIERDDSPWRMALGPGDDLGRSSQCLAVGTAGKG
jgi:ribosomal protein S18 acetylase RimI-like enzyme